MRRLLVIAGTDSSGGAGLTRDVATAQDLGVQVMPVVTAVTAQSDHALHQALEVSPSLIAQQITTACDAARPCAVKIGMLGNMETADAVMHALKGHDIPVIIDPVLKTTSGGALHSGKLPLALYGRATVLTPNLLEAAEIAGSPIATRPDDIATQARELRQMTGAGAVLIKGGHHTGAQCTDVLCDASGIQEFPSPRLHMHRRGTGCTLATAIACFVAQGHPLPAACLKAKSYVFEWIVAKADVPNGND